MRTKFDKEYYDHFYRNPSTQVASRQDATTQADFIHAYLRHLNLPINSIIDVGCGLGHHLSRLSEKFTASCSGFEISDYLCAEYGWSKGSVVDIDCPPADLVICYDVVEYLPDVDAHKAIETIARITRSALFFGALTKEDWALCDQDRTDPEVCLRSGHWYQKRLYPHFLGVGGGLFLKQPTEAVIWTLDRLGMSG